MSAAGSAAPPAGPEPAAPARPEPFVGGRATDAGARERVLVVGDSMLDRYWEGTVERISPEAPVPVLRLGQEWQRAGGAANVAMNLAALQCPATLATLLGADDAGTLLAALLQGAGVALAAVQTPGHVTTQKIRAVCRRQQLLRIDIEVPAQAAHAQALADRVGDLLPQHRWLLLSDYAKGAVADSAALIRRATARGCQVLVDPKSADFTRYRGAWLLKPNESEALQAAGALGVGGSVADTGASGSTADADAAFDARMAVLRETVGVLHLLVTRGERGMVLYSAARPPVRVHGRAREVYDVSGAGDTVLATLASALAEGRTLDGAVAEANRAAGIVVGKFGTATVSRAELASESLAEVARGGAGRAAADGPALQTDPARQPAAQVPGNAVAAAAPEGGAATSGVDKDVPP